MPTVIGYHDVKDKDHWLASPKREEFFGPLGVTNIRWKEWLTSPGVGSAAVNLKPDARSLKPAASAERLRHRLASGHAQGLAVDEASFLGGEEDEGGG